MRREEGGKQNKVVSHEKRYRTLPFNGKRYPNTFDYQSHPFSISHNTSPKFYIYRHIHQVQNTN